MDFVHRAPLIFGRRLGFFCAVEEVSSLLGKVLDYAIGDFGVYLHRGPCDKIAGRGYGRLYGRRQVVGVERAANVAVCAYGHNADNKQDETCRHITGDKTQRRRDNIVENDRKGDGKTAGKIIARDRLQEHKGDHRNGQHAQ